MRYNEFLVSALAECRKMLPTLHSFNLWDFKVSPALFSFQLQNHHPDTVSNRNAYISYLVSVSSDHILYVLLSDFRLRFISDPKTKS